MLFNTRRYYGQLLFDVQQTLAGANVQCMISGEFSGVPYFDRD
jgi:hypothetical protein